MQSNVHTRFPLATLALLAVAGGASGQSSGQVQFSVDWQGPPVGAPDSAFAFPITEGDVLRPAGGSPAFGPMPLPGIRHAAGFGPAPGLGLPLHGACVGHLGGTACAVEVDALSYGVEPRLTPATPLRHALLFSVDEWAIGIPGLPAAPDVQGEAPVGDASADLMVDWGLAPGPLAPFAAPAPGHVAVVDGDGMPSGSGALYRGLGLVEPNAPAAGVPDGGSNLDAVVLGPFGGQWPTTGVYFSLDAAFGDPLEGVLNSGSAAAHGFVGGDVLHTAAPSGVPALFAPAGLLGLDLLGVGSDDLDALILAENGSGAFERSLQPYDWVAGNRDMLLFSVRRNSAVIGMPDSIFGLPIEEGDLLTTPLAPAFGGVSPFPGIFIAAENLGLATLRSGTAPAAGSADDLDAAELLHKPLYDCNGNGREDAVDVAAGSSADANGNGVPDECETTISSFCLCPAALAPCGNADPAAGCANSTGQGGLLTAAGSTSVGADDLVLTATQLPLFQPGILIMGPASVAPIPFGDGLRCVGGPIYRFAPPQGSGAGGTMSWGTGLVAYTIANNPPAGWIVAGSTWHFQTWYRDPAGPCGTSTNLTSAIQALFVP